jgi:hypothetical protein
MKEMSGFIGLSAPVHLFLFIRIIFEFALRRNSPLTIHPSCSAKLLGNRVSSRAAPQKGRALHSFQM